MCPADVDEALKDLARADLSVAEVHRLFGVAVVQYAKRRRGDGAMPACELDEAVTATDVLVVVSDLLKAADIELFELGMWQAWGPDDERSLQPEN